MKFEWTTEEVGVFSEGETVVGTIQWFDDQWSFFSGPGDPPSHGATYIEVDAEAEAGFRAERAAIAEQPEAVRDALNAELDGRLHAFMLDTQYLARAKGMILVRQGDKAPRLPLTDPDTLARNAEIKSAWRAGSTTNEIAKHYGISYWDVHRILEGGGLIEPEVDIDGNPVPHERKDFS